MLGGTRLLWLACLNAPAEGVFIGSALLQCSPLTPQSDYFNRFSSAQQVSSKLAGLCQPGPRDAAASSSMVCLLPGAVTFSCVRSMSCLLSSHHSECPPAAAAASASRCKHPTSTCTSVTVPTSGCTSMAFARLGGEFCQAQHLLLIVDK